jgi:hypothetical protein
LRWQWKKLADDPCGNIWMGMEHPEARSLKVAPPTGGTFQCKTIGENNAFVSLSKQWYEHGLYVETAFVDFVAGLQLLCMHW